MNFNNKKIGIAGLGLMGGSFALTLKNQFPQCLIKGYDFNNQHCIEALNIGIADEIADSIEELLKCDIIILAVPVNAIASILKKISSIPKSTLIIDLGSTKKYIIDSIPKTIRKNFVAAHPMTGTEKSGPTAALPHLYDNKTVVICNIEDSGILQKKTAIALFEKLKMKIIYMNAAEHDNHAAFISHLPHALSYALANTVLKQENPESITALAGGGFRDMSRIAKTPPDMWIDIFQQNKKSIIEDINAFHQELHACSDMINSENWDALKKWIQNANKLDSIL